MVLPIVPYGDPVLRKKSNEVSADFPDLQKIIKNMFDTMYDANGVGLAAPQIGKNIRVFVADASPFAEDKTYKNEAKMLVDFKKVFINAKMIEETGEPWKFNEGCLSIPNVREDVLRKPTIKIQYYDENFNYFEEEFDGLRARIIQHEYDHIEGVLFTDLISPLKKRLIKGKLNSIAKGIFNADYFMRFTQNKR